MIIKYGWSLYYIFLERNAGRCLLVLRKRKTAITTWSSQWRSDTHNWSVITGELVSVKRLQRSPGISLLSAVGRNVLFTIVSCKGIWIPKSENFLHVESGILGFGIRNRARGIPNPTKKMESGIQFPLTLESTARNPESKTVLDPGRLLGEILIECTYACTPSCTRQECWSYWHYHRTRPIWNFRSYRC